MLLTHLRLILFIFSMNEKKYVEHKNTCARRRHSAEIIIKKNLKIANTI